LRASGLGPRVRVVPDGWTKEKSARLSSLGLRQMGFHTVMWAPLDGKDAGGTPMPLEEGIRISRVTDAAEHEIALDVQIEGWGIPYSPDSLIKKLRRGWRNLPDHRVYLAYLDDQPAAFAMLYLDGKIGYLESACTIERFRRRGLHSA